MLYKKHFQNGGILNQVICAILINLPVLAYGASIGWMSPMTLLLQSEKTPRGIPLTDLEVSWMAAVPYLVCIPSDWAMAWLTDKFGRKKTLLLISISSAASWILLLCSFKMWVLILARALVGLSMAGCYVTCPIYTKEISEPHIRGALGCLVILFHTTGNLFLYIIGDILSYNVILLICLAIPGIHLLLFLLMPDSPSYLVKKGRIEDATRALSWLRCRPESDVKVQEELDLIRKEQNNDEANKFLLKAIFMVDVMYAVSIPQRDDNNYIHWLGNPRHAWTKSLLPSVTLALFSGVSVHDKILFRAFKIALIITLAREGCGAVPVLNFAGDIFSMASNDGGLIISPNQQAMLIGGVQVLGSALSSSLVEKSGRKPLLFTTSLLSGLSMCTLASWFLLREYGIVAPAWLPLTTLCVCIFCDSSGLQPMSIVITGEIFSYRYRGTIMALTMSCASLGDFIQVLFFKTLANVVGIHVSFYIFGTICLLVSIYVILVIPETRGRSLEDIYQDLRSKKDLKAIVNEDYYETKGREVTRI